MVCPYCGGHNPPGAAACTHCGAILYGAACAHPHRKLKKRSRGRGIFILVVLALLIFGAAIGGYLGHHVIDRALWEGALIGGLVGALIGAILGGGRSLFLSYLYRARHASLQARIQSTLNAAQARYEMELKAPSPSPQTRLNMAGWHLLQSDTDKVIQVLQMAQKFGASGLEFDNNAGIALAKRGSLAQALPPLQRAITYPDAPASCFANLAHLFIETPNEPESVNNAFSAVREAIARDAKRPRYYALLGAAFVLDDRLDDAGKQFEYELKLAAADRAAEADAHTNIGSLRAREGNTDEAMRAFSAAVAMDPGHACARANLGIAKFVGGDRDQGLETLLDANFLDPGNAGILSALGCVFCRTGAANDGIRACREALALDLHLFEPYANLGKAYADAHLPDLADHYLKEAAHRRPRSWEVLQTYGVVKLSLGFNGEACELFENAVHIRPQHGPLLVNLAAAYALVGRDAEAVRRLEQALRLDKNSGLLHGHRAWLYLRADSSSLAAAEIEIALQTKPKNAILHNNYGLAEVGLGAYEIALESLLHAHKLKPDLHPVHYHLGGVYALLKQPEAAIKEWEAAAKYESENPDCFTNLGAGYYRKGNYDTAATHFRHVLQIRHDRPEDYSNLGLAYAKQGVEIKRKVDGISKATQLIVRNSDERLREALEMHRKAIEQFDHALTIAPDNVILHSNRGLACYFANRPEEAMREWGNVSRLDPLYARRRGKAQQTEFDDSQVDYIPLDVPKRAIMLPLETGPYLHKYVWGYDIAAWEPILSDPELAPLPGQIRELEALERTQRALTL